MKETLNLYHAKLQIDPISKRLSAQVRFTYYARNDAVTEFRLYLHRDLHIQSIVGTNLASYTVGSVKADWILEESKLVLIHLAQPIYNGESVELEFTYSGTIPIVGKWQINRITADWVELGIYSPWYPLLEEMDRALFKVEISIDPTYQVLGSRSIIKKDNHWLINQVESSNDCSFLAAKDFKALKANVNDNSDSELTVYYVDNKHMEIANQVLKVTSWCLDYYYQHFGAISLGQQAIVIAPRETGGGYARPGLIVLNLNGEEDEMELFRYLAHEVGHFWWNKVSNANSWEDWLNESFAEYSTFLAVRKNYGEAKFDEYVEKYKSKVEGLPPVKGISRSDENAYLVLYYKGTMLLWELEKMLGRDAFAHLLRETHEQQVASTEAFLDLLQELSGIEVVECFSNLLIR